MIYIYILYMQTLEW